MSQHLLNYTLQLADNALIIGHRISEWCGHGPVLEQDIAITNTALDHIGQARSLYQYAAEQYNNLSATNRENLFVSPLPETVEEDTFPYLRDAWDFKNVLLLEQANGDWAKTVARSFFYDHFTVLLYEQLKKTCKDANLAAIAEKSLKEALYHKKWSSEWMIRLGDGTDESRQRLLMAVEELWPFTGEMFMASEADKAMAAQGIAPDLESLKTTWQQQVFEILEEATMPLPDANAWMHSGGKTGTHTEYLGYILTELQFVQRAYPGLVW